MKKIPFTHVNRDQNFGLLRCAMENKDYAKDSQLNFEKDIDCGNRRYDDRRKEPCEGFTYVSTVGWICRREQCRRKDDPFDCNS
jgi:hypothetical protein